MTRRASSPGLSLFASVLVSMSCSNSLVSSPANPSDCRALEPRPIGPNTKATPRPPRPGVSWRLPRQFEHVLIIVFENQDYDVVMGEPYFHRLARRGALFTRYDSDFHPSYPNYLALVGGKYFGTAGDEQLDIPQSERTIVDLLEGIGLTWREYAEAYPGGCYRGDEASGPLYRRKHVPFLSFDSVAKSPHRCASVVPATQFDRKRLPNFALYSPDMCHDGHDLCATGFERVKAAIEAVPGMRYLGFVPPKLHQAATWLEEFLEPILGDAEVMKDTLVVVTFDESDTESNNHVYTVFLGGMVQGGGEIEACHDHYGLLRTIEANFGLGTLGAEDERSDPIVGGVWRQFR